MTVLAPHLSAFMGEYLPRDRGASRHTVDSYALSFLLLLGFAAERLRIPPSKIQIEQLTTELILDFLEHLERDRGNCASTRNVRLAALKSFFRYLEYRQPQCLDLARQVHALPAKRHQEGIVDYLDHDEVKALVNAPDPGKRSGIRDRAMLHLAYAAGLRVSELVALACRDLGQPGLDVIRINGKGRRQRLLPLWKQTRSALRHWLEVRPGVTSERVFLNARGTPMSRHGFAHRLRLHADATRKRVPSLVGKRISPHVLRHTCAIHTLEATRDIRKVSVWLGHASVQSTEIYLRGPIPWTSLTYWPHVPCRPSRKESSLMRRTDC